MRLTAISLGMAASAMAADVSLKGGGKLTGEVTGMDETGIITLASPVSGKPLLLRGDAIVKVDFPKSDDTAPVPAQRVELVNGDMIPARITSMDGKSLFAQSPHLGNLSIPREAVSSIQLGIFPEKVIYSGPEDFKGWKRDGDGSRSWDKFKDGQFVAGGQGTLSRDVGLPEKFILRFTLSWDKQPNFQLLFADPQGKPGRRVDRYAFEFSGAGLGIFRESAGKGGRTPIMLLARGPEQFAGNTADMEIRVDRARALIQVFLNGVLEGRYTDPVPDVPTGSGITLVSRAPGESGLRIGKIRILAWDDRGDRHRSEDRGEGTDDSLIGRSGERFGGDLESIRTDDGSTVYLFRSDFQKEILEMPEEEVSTVFLGGNRNLPGEADGGGLILHLRGNGEMRVSSCVFGVDSAMAVHPLLGPIKVDRAGIASLERHVIPKAKAVKSR